jgi:hypothetical protein
MQTKQQRGASLNICALFYAFQTIDLPLTTALKPPRIFQLRLSARLGNRSSPISIDNPSLLGCSGSSLEIRLLKIVY